MKLRFLPLVVVLAAPAIARATPEDDKALATELFAKGIKKMEAGKCDQPKPTDPAVCEEARELFTRAYEIYPAGLGALRNLAYVERGLGHTASAARRFRDLQQKAPQDPNPKRHIWAEYAAKELETLEPLIPHISITCARSDASITVDGKPLPAGAWGTSVEIDPGPHKIRAEAKGAKPFETNVTLAEKESKSVEVKLEDGEAPPPPPPPPTEEKKGSSRVAPLIVTGVGAITLGVGLAYGYGAISKKQEACGDTKLCEPTALDQAQSNARTANILTGVGAAVTVGGLLWFFLTPRDEPKSARIVPSVGHNFAGAFVVGSFQ
jgi:hypothetical protein